MPQTVASQLLTNSFCIPSLVECFSCSLSACLAAAMQQTAQGLHNFLLWNVEQVCTAGNNLFRSMEKFAEPKTHRIFCSCTPSGQDSERSSPDYYGSSEASPSNSEAIEGTDGCQLHYPPNTFLDSGNVSLISLTSMAHLEAIIQMHVGSGCEEALLQAFTDNSDASSSFFYQLDGPWVLRRGTKTFTDSSHFTEELAEKWIIMLKINTEILRLMQHQLCEEGRLFGERKIDYFAQFAKSPIKKLMEIAISLSKANWSAHHICPMLLAYEALRDVLPIIQKFPSSESHEEFFSKILDNMREAFRGMFKSMKDFIRCEMESQQSIAIHPMTCFLIRSMKTFSSHRNLVQSTLAPGDDISSFGYLLDDLINCWRSELWKCQESYSEQQRAIFLLNNIKHFEEIASLLDGLLSNSELVEKHKNDFQLRSQQLTERYKEASWGPAKSILNCNYRSRRSMVEFWSKFQDTFDLQKTWKVPNPELKQELRDCVENFILPEYRNSVDELRGYPRLFCFPCCQGDVTRGMYTVESLQRAVQGLFEG